MKITLRILIISASMSSCGYYKLFDERLGKHIEFSEPVYTYRCKRCDFDEFPQALPERTFLSYYKDISFDMSDIQKTNYRKFIIKKIYINYPLAGISQYCFISPENQEDILFAAYCSETGVKEAVTL